ncbi:MAG: molybdopterin-dependent oxidoreductase [Actinomycetales bacterium]
MEVDEAPAGVVETATRGETAGSNPMVAAALVASAAIGLAAGEVAAALLNPASSPLAAVGDTFIDLVPAWLKNIAVAVFGVFDKLALVIGMLLVLAGLFVALARVIGAHPRVAIPVFAVLSMVAGVAATTRPGAGPLDWVPSVACLLTASAGWLLLQARLPRVDAGAQGAADQDEQVLSQAPGRRGFLTIAAAVAGAAGLVGLTARIVGGRVGSRSPAPGEADLPVPGVSAPAAPDGVDPAVDGLTPYRTANQDFYRIDTALVVPRVDPQTWRLRVFGEVEREVELSYDELIGADLVQAWVTLTCVSNPVGGSLAGNATWTGLPIHQLLARAGPAPGADMVLSRSVDGWTASTPLDVLTDPDRACLLAVAMNDKPLPAEHGYPVRMVVPGLYGYVSATKWVTELEVTRFSRRAAYWTTRGWSPQGPVKTASRIDVPRPGARVQAGEVVVAGVAWAQHRGIEAVEVQVDEGRWQPAELASTIGPDTWRQWTFRWRADPGRHRLRVRATDAAGVQQTGSTAAPAPDGATGWHSVEIRVQ